MRTYIITALVLFTSVSCNNAEVDTKKESEILMQTSRDWSSAAVARDVEKILGYWAEDAILISAGQPTLKGKNQIRQMIEGSLKDPSFRISWEPKTAEISKMGDMGYLLEETKMTMSDSLGQSHTTTFNAITIWKKQPGGSWKNVVDVMIPH